MIGSDLPDYSERLNAPTGSEIGQMPSAQPLGRPTSGSEPERPGLTILARAPLH
jgi:hypothetical protein